MNTKIEITDNSDSLQPLKFCIGIGNISCLEDLDEMEKFITECRIDIAKRFADKQKFYDAINAKTAS